MHDLTRITSIALLCAALTGPGCTTSTYFDTDPPLEGPVAVSLDGGTELVRILPIHSGDGAAMGWQDLLDACAWAEVIVIGELHDDATGHAVQRAIVHDLVAGRDGIRTALAMEMLERDEQQLVADYYDGIIDAAQFAKLTHSASWAGKGSWAAWYQPIIDAARHHGSPTIAANAPRRYVRLARTDGYDALRAIPQPRRSLFDLPTSLATGGYRARFIELMSAMGRHDDADDDHSASVNTAQIEAMYRSQMVWDATMAASVVRELRDRSDRVVLLVGQFHSDFNGGTVQEIRRRSPTSRILTISMQQRGQSRFHGDDRDRADIVIYTGSRSTAEEVDEPHVDSDDQLHPVTASPHDAPPDQPNPPAPPPALPATQPDETD